MVRLSDYLFTPVDVARAVRRVALNTTLRDCFGAAIVVAIGFVLRGVFDWGLGGMFFLEFLFVTLWWRVSSRVSFSLALACLILIPMLLILFSKNVLPYGEIWADKVVVWAYYFLVIGTLREIVVYVRDSRRNKRSNRFFTDIHKPS